MATIIERDVHHLHDASGDSSSLAAMVVTVVALLTIAGFALFAFQLFPFNIDSTPNNADSININAEIPTPTPTPDSMNY